MRIKLIYVYILLCTFLLPAFARKAILVFVLRNIPIHQLGDGCARDVGKLRKRI